MIVAMVKQTLIVTIALALVQFALPSLALAADKSVAITPSKLGESDGSSSSGGATMWMAENIKLYDALERLCPEKVWPSDAAKALPEGRFDIKLSGYSKKDPAAFAALAAEVKKQFGVEVSVVEEDRDGYTLALPGTDKVTKADSEDSYMMMTTGKGWSLKAATLKEIAEWLQGEIETPVAPKDASEARVSFELAVSPFKPEELTPALEKLGFVIAKEKVKVKLLKAAKAG